ncbi:MAG TPA: hypothetical protein VHS80_03150 [Chthoniobacterales bacterium]|nr:hypothetical protein [Chthoniobacterales bacterium]
MKSLLVINSSGRKARSITRQLTARFVAAQRERFEDIVVKYRDPGNQVAVTNGNESDTRPSTDEGPKRGRNGKSGFSGGGRRNIPGQELDELATILTPEQIKQFQQLNGKKGKGGEAHDRRE